MESTEAQHAAQRPFTAPTARWSDGDWARDVVLVVVHKKSQWTVHKLYAC